MKTLLISALTALALLGSTASFADRDDGRQWRSRHDNGHHRGWDRGDRRDRWDRHDNDHVSINIGIGSGWGYPYPRSSFGFGVNTYGSRWVNPPTRWVNRNRPVVIYQNTYIERSAPRTTVITRSAPRTGMLRDVDGRCFVRETDRYGNETRTEVSPSECDF